MSEVKLGDSIYLHIGTADPSTGSATNADALPTVTIEEDGVAMGYSPVVTNVTTGLYRVTIDVTIGNGFEAGKRYSAYVSATVMTVAGVDSLIDFLCMNRETDDLATSTALATVQADTDDIQGRLPATLSGGKMRSQIEGMDVDPLTSGALAPRALGEIADG